MTDINNNINNKIGHVQNVNFAGEKADTQQTNGYNKTKEIKNLDKSHAALIGRSMIKKMQKPEVPAFDKTTIENIKADLAELNKNPKLVKQSMAVFDAAIAKGYTPKQADQIAQEFIKNFS